MININYKEGELDKLYKSKNRTKNISKNYINKYVYI